MKEVLFLWVVQICELCLTFAQGTTQASGIQGLARNFGIVEPWPDNVYPIEFTSTQVTCVAFDASGLQIPQKIQFVRYPRFVSSTLITADGNIYFTIRSEKLAQGVKLYTTMHIRNVTFEHDSNLGSLGRYECHAYAVNDSVPKKHGFTVNVIPSNEIPIVLVSVPKFDVLKKGEEIMIACNVTRVVNLSGLKLKRISWFKDGVRVQTVRCPLPNVPEDTLQPLVVKDGGNYSCILELLLRGVFLHMVSDFVVIRYAPLCLEENSEGVLWSNTSSGGTDLKPCPHEGIGTASRYCSEGGKWNLSNFTGCRSAKLIDLNDTMDAILNGGSPGNNVHTILSDLEDALRLKAANNSSRLQRIFGGDLIISVGILSKIAEYNRIHGNVSSPQNFKKFAQAASHLLEKKNSQTWTECYDAGKGKSTILVETMDDYGLGVAATFDKSAQLQVETDNLLMRINSIRQNSEIRVEGMKVVFMKSSIYLPPQAFSSSEDSLVVSLIYQTLNEVLRLSKEPDGDPGGVFTANTSIVSSTVSPNPRNVLNKPINIVLENKQMSSSVPFSTTRPSGKCLFWRPGEPETWNTSGCRFVASKSNLDVTTCECNHLTVFAALMDPYGRVESKPHTKALELISTVGCSISLLAVSITVVVHLYFWRVLKSPRTKVLLNLCAAVAFTCALVISEGKARNKVILCTVVAALLHYFLLALFSWMLCEGMLHYMLLVRVLRNDTVSKMKFFYIFGWGFPALVVAISLIITRAGGYGGEDVCWLNVKNGLIWAFIGPALLVISVNIVVFVLVLKNMMGTVSMQSKEQIEQVKAGIKASAVILPLLGITWLFGLLSFNSDTIAFKYIFSIFNSLQGLTLFVFHCVLNRQVKDAFKVHQQKRKAKYPFKSNHARGIQEEIPPNKAANRRLHQNPKNNDRLSEITDFDYGPKKPSAMKNEEELTCAVVHRTTTGSEEGQNIEN